MARTYTSHTQTHTNTNSKREYTQKRWDQLNEMNRHKFNEYSIELYYCIEIVAHNAEWLLLLLFGYLLHCFTGAPLLVVFVILYRNTALICLPLAGFSAKRSLMVLNTASLFSWTMFVSLFLPPRSRCIYSNNCTTEMAEKATTTYNEWMNELSIDFTAFLSLFLRRKKQQRWKWTKQNSSEQQSKMMWTNKKIEKTTQCIQF